MRFDGCDIMFYKKLSYHLYADVHFYLKSARGIHTDLITWYSNHYLALPKIFYALITKHLLLNI